MLNFYLDESGNTHGGNLAWALSRSAKPGEIITFGVYPQTANGADKTPIKWRVVENSGTELFLLSEYVLDCKRYHGEYTDITWRDCDLRKWLNDVFYNVAFNTNEREFVTTTCCSDNGEGSPDTEDKVFLLSVAEVKSFTNKHGKGSSDARRPAVGTEFAKVKQTDGCHLYVYDKSVSDDYLTENDTAQGCSWWSLRTQLGNGARDFCWSPRQYPQLRSRQS